MRKIITLAFFLFLFTRLSYAQASDFQDHSVNPIFIAGIELVIVLVVVFFLLPRKSKADSTDKEKSFVGLGIFGFVLLAMMATNPSLDDHRHAVGRKLLQTVTKFRSGESSDDWVQFAIQLGESMGKLVLDQVVERENYLLFSISTLQVDHAKRDVGIGIFGHVWIIN